MAEHFSATQDTFTVGQLAEAVTTRMLRDMAEKVEWGQGEAARLRAFAFEVSSTGVAHYITTQMDNQQS